MNDHRISQNFLSMEACPIVLNRFLVIILFFSSKLAQTKGTSEGYSSDNTIKP